MPFKIKTVFEIEEAIKAPLEAEYPGAFISPLGVLPLLVKGSALQDAEQYLQMARILDSTDLDQAKGTALDEKALEYDEVRLEARKSTGFISVGDSNLTSKVSGTLQGGALPIGTTILNLGTGEGTAFGSTFPFQAIIDRDDATDAEYVTVRNRSGDQLSVDPTTKAHAGGDSIIKSTVGVDRVIIQGTGVEVPETINQDVIRYQTTQEGYLKDGDVVSDPISIESLQVGAETVVGAGRINAFTFENKPFFSATVTNEDATRNGRDLEEDDEFRSRIKRNILNKSRGTAVAIESFAVGVTDGVKTVLTAQVDEPVGIGKSTLWIDDGTGTLTAEPVTKAGTEVIAYDAEGGEQRFRLENWPVIKGTLTGKLFKDEETGEATSVGVNFLTDTSKTWGVNVYAGFTLVDDNAQLYSIVSNTSDTLTLSGGLTPSLGSYSLVDFGASYSIFDVSELPTTVPSATDDFLVNYSTGEIELNALKYPTGLGLNGSIVLNNGYDYATGLFKEVARVIEGDFNDLENYPGVKAIGTYIEIESPVVITQTFTIQIRSADFLESELSPQVKDVVIQYVNSLQIGDNIVLSEIIRRVKSITGILDVKIITPSSNVVILQGQLPRTDSDKITVV